MEAWIRRPGHPVVAVRRENGRLALEQRRFLLSGSRPDEPWPIPLVVETGGRTERRVFDRSRAEIVVPPGAEWRVNPDRQGFYRVRYSGELLAEISSRFARLSGADRWGLLEDLFAFALSGDARLSTYLEFVERCADDPEYIVAHAVADRLFWLRPLAGTRADFVRADRRFFARQLERLGETRRPDEPDTAASLRHWILLGRVRSDPAFARALAERWSEYDTSDADLRPAIAVAYARASGAEALPGLMDRFLHGRSEEEALQAGVALSDLEDGPSLARAIQYAVSDEIPLARGHALYHFTARNPLGPRVVWPFTQARADEMARRWSGTPLLGAALEELIPYHGLGREDEVKRFFASHPFPEADRSVAKALELLGVFARFVAREGADGEPPVWDEGPPEGAPARENSASAASPTAR
jgi:tricorn protease interacting factor F2/3